MSPRRKVGWTGGEKVRRRAKEPEPQEDSDDIDVEALLEEAKADRKEREAPARSRADEVAEAIGVDVRNECPVCSSLEPCDCSEEERTFVRRIRHECEVTSGVPRCSRCKAPLSVLHIPRPNAVPPYDLKDMIGAMGCLPCLTGTLGVTAMAAWLKV